MITYSVKERAVGVGVAGDREEGGQNLKRGDRQYREGVFIKQGIRNPLPTMILEPLTHNKVTIKDSFNFAKEITTYESSIYMASLDAEFLFTYITLNKTINNYVRDENNKKNYNGKLSKRDLFKLIGTATIKSSFIFDSLPYKHVDRIAIASPLGPTLANAFLCHYEREWLDNFPIHLKYTKGMLMISVFFFHLKNTSNLLQII